MYNEQIKESFISHFTTKLSTKNAFRVLFDATEEYERRFNADICTFSSEQLSGVINNILGVRNAARQSRLYHLRSYAKWCMENQIPGACDNIMKADITDNARMKFRTVASPLHLQLYLDRVFDKESEESVDNVFRCFCWLAYMGVPMNEVSSIRGDDVDIENMVLIHNGKEYPVYRESVPAIRNCKKLYSFRFNHPNYKEKTVFRERTNPSMLLSTSSKTIDVVYIRRKVSDAIVAANKKDAEAEAAEAARRAVNLALRETTSGISAQTAEAFVRAAVITAANGIKPGTEQANGTNLNLVAERAASEAYERKMNESIQLSYFRIQMSGLFYRMFQLETAGLQPDFSVAVAEHKSGREYRLDKSKYTDHAHSAKIERSYQRDYNAWKNAFYTR